MDGTIEIAIFDPAKTTNPSDDCAPLTLAPLADLIESFMEGLSKN